MKSVMNLSIAFLLGLSNFAVASDLSPYIWKKRPILIFADNIKDIKFQTQMKILSDNRTGINERDIIVLSNKASLRKKYKPQGFTFILIGKDGGVKLRRNKPVSMRELSLFIDAMPMRQREIQQQN